MPGFTTMVGNKNSDDDNANIIHHLKFLKNNKLVRGTTVKPTRSRSDTSVAHTSTATQGTMLRYRYSGMLLQPLKITASGSHEG